MSGEVRFTNAVGGTADFIYPGPAIDMQSPASAGVIEAVIYGYYAQSLDMSQWEIGSGVYTASSKTFARSNIVANSLGTTAKINFGNPPQIVVSGAFQGDITVSRPISPTTGAIFFGNSTSPYHYLYFDGTNYQFNAGDLLYPGTAWTGFTSTPSCSAGAYASANAVVRYKLIGKTAVFWANLNIVSIGTATGYPIMTLPFTCGPAFQMVVGREVNVAGYELVGQLSPSSNTLLIINYAGGAPVTSGSQFLLTGVCEIA